MSEPQPLPPAVPIQPDVPNPVAPPSRRSRITLATTLVHNVPGYDGRRPDVTRFSQNLESDEQHFEKRCRVGEEWAAIPLSDEIMNGGCSVLSVINKTTIPTVAKQRAISPRRTDGRGVAVTEEAHWVVLIVGLQVGDEVYEFASLAPGQELPISPMRLDQYRVRAEEGQCRYNVFAVPM